MPTPPFLTNDRQLHHPHPSNAATPPIFKELQPRRVPVYPIPAETGKIAAAPRRVKFVERDRFERPGCPSARPVCCTVMKVGGIAAYRHYPTLVHGIRRSAVNISVRRQPLLLFIRPVSRHGITAALRSVSCQAHTSLLTAAHPPPLPHTVQTILKELFYSDLRMVCLTHCRVSLHHNYLLPCPLLLCDDLKALANVHHYEFKRTISILCSMRFGGNVYYFLLQLTTPGTESNRCQIRNQTPSHVSAYTPYSNRNLRHIEQKSF